MYICYCPLRDLNWNKNILYSIVLYCIVLYCIVFSYYKSCVETATSSVHVEEELKPVSATACQQHIAFTSTPDPVRPEFVSPCGVSDISSGGERGL